MASGEISSNAVRGISGSFIKRVAEEMDTPLLCNEFDAADQRTTACGGEECSYWEGGLIR